MKSFRLSAVLLVTVLGSSIAQAPSQKQVELDAIAARAQDLNNAQPSSVTDRQLHDWTAKYGGSVEKQQLAMPESLGKNPPPARIMATCKTSTKNGHTCRLVMAEQSGSGKMSCTYVCS